MPQLAEAPDPFSGTAVGSHRLRERIGRGPRASVYLASPPSGSEPLLAFKLFSPEASGDPDFSARCFDAAESSRRFSHPCVVKVLEVGRQETRGYVLMELAPGGSLEKLLETERRLPFDRATRILRDAALGLEAALTTGLYHLNLKPTNILFASDGRARLSDFGQGWQPRLGRGLQPEDPILGIVDYLSPEQIEGQLPEQTTDLFALGVIYYRMLTGRLPFPGVDDREIAMSRLTSPPRPVRESFAGVDPRAIPILEKLLARRPEARFQTARGLLAVVERLVKGKTSSLNAKASGPTPTDSVIPSEVRMRLSFSSAAAHFGPGLGLIAIGGLVAPGSPGFFRSVGSLFSSTVSMSFAAAGFIALAVGCFLFRRELRNSGRARVVLGLIAGAAVSALVGGLALDRQLWSGRVGVLVAPVNLILGAAGLAWFGVARCFDQDENTEGMRAPRVCLGLAALLWFLGWAAGNLLGPFSGIGAAPAIIAPLVLATLAAAVFGAIAVVNPATHPRVRRMAVILMSVGATGLAMWASAGAAGSLASPGSWFSSLLTGFASMPAQIPRSGAPILLAVGLVATSDYVLRAGLIRFYAKK